MKKKVQNSIIFSGSKISITYKATNPKAAGHKYLAIKNYGVARIVTLSIFKPYETLFGALNDLYIAFGCYVRLKNLGYC